MTTPATPPPLTASFYVRQVVQDGHDSGQQTVSLEAVNGMTASATIVLTGPALGALIPGQIYTATLVPASPAS